MEDTSRVVGYKGKLTVQLVLRVKKLISMQITTKEKLNK